MTRQRKSLRSFCSLLLSICMVLTMSLSAFGAKAEAASGSTPKDGEYTVAVTFGGGSMFKILPADEGKGKLTVENGDMSVYFRNSGQGYDYVYLGTKDEAVNDEANWIKYEEANITEVVDGVEITSKVHAFTVPVSALDTEIPLATRGQKSGNWNDYTMTVSSEGVEFEEEETSEAETTEAPSTEAPSTEESTEAESTEAPAVKPAAPDVDYSVDSALVTCDLSMFSPVEGGTSVTVNEGADGLADGTLSVTILTRPVSRVYDKIALISQDASEEEKEAAAIEAVIYDNDACEFTFEIPVEEIGKQIPVSMYQTRKGVSEWHNWSEQKYLTVNYTPELVGALIDAIYVQARNDATDTMLKAAKDGWDALSDEDKELVEGEEADPDYFGRDTGDASKDDPRNADEIGENELLVVSFGTSFNNSRVDNIKAVEDALDKEFGEKWSVRRAFTAQIIINHIQARDGEVIDNMDQALERAVANGVKNLVIQPTHLMSGAEYDELSEAVSAYESKFTQVKIAAPLLNTAEDKTTVAEAITAKAVEKAGYKSLDAAEADGTAFVFMGHGTSHTANVTYTLMQNTVDKLGYKNVFIGTVEGLPESTSCENVIAAVKAAGYTKVVLRPLMVVAGDHANNDMADPEDPESWISQFTADGSFSKIDCQIDGLGSIEDVQAVYVEHTREAMDELIDDEDLAAAQHVADLIDAIYVQEYTEDTWAQCEEAKAAWDALTDEQKELVEGEFADPGYFGDDTGDASKDDPRNQDEIGENELLVVSFGTSFNDSRVENIKAVEDALQEAYPEWSVRRAFTAQIIINHVYARDGEKMDNMQQALDRAVANGVKNLVIQPTHLMSGAEYDELKAAVDEYADKFVQVKIGAPLLTSIDDKDRVAEAITSKAVEKAGYDSLEAAEADGTAFVFMGHGTSHTANVTYTLMQNTVDKLGYKNVFIGTVEGLPEPTSCENVIAAVKAAGYTKVVLRPLMVVAGDHANNDMADPEDPESWISQFTADGSFSSIDCQIEGLGSIEDVQQIYIEHVAAVMEEIVDFATPSEEIVSSLSMFKVLEDGSEVTVNEDGTVTVTFMVKPVSRTYNKIALVEQTASEDEKDAAAFEAEQVPAGSQTAAKFTITIDVDQLGEDMPLSINQTSVDGVTDWHNLSKQHTLTVYFTPEIVAQLIDLIYVQERTDATDALCAAAKKGWDALTDEQKEMVEGEEADPDYFGRDTGDASKDDPRNADEIGEKELLVVSFGTSFNDSRVENIKAVEDALDKAYGKEWSVRRAFTAQIIINHIQARDGETIDNMDQALERAVANGVKNLVIQPTHLMSGAEYDELSEAVAAYTDKFDSVKIADPLLTTAEDKTTVAEAITAKAVEKAGYDSLEAAEADGTAFVFMGHGTSHTANVTYTLMQNTVDKLGYKNVFIGTVEGLPESTSCENVIAAVKAAGYTKVVLRPLMVVAGDHAHNDMADPEDPESWISQFTADGSFSQIDCQIDGLGSIEDVQKLYVLHTEPHVIGAYTPGTPEVTSVAADGKEVTVEWTAAEGAAGYVIYVKAPGSDAYKRLAEVKDGSAESYTYTVDAFGKYAYKVKAYGKVNGHRVTGTRSAAKSIVVRPNTTIFALQSGKGKITVTWSPQEGVDGYVVYKATSTEGTYKAAAKFEGNSTRKYVDTKVTVGKTYYYKVKAYVLVNGKKCFEQSNNYSSAAAR